MIECGKEYKCKCGLTNNWNGKEMVLENHHINGNWLDDRKENLMFLCPNCHSQENKSRSDVTGSHDSLRGCCPDGREGSNPSFGIKMCIECDRKIYRTSTRCKSCAAKRKPTKINWLSIETLKEKIAKTSFSAVAKELGVSDNAVRKRIKNHS